jgi:hypothetical protein
MVDRDVSAAQRSGLRMWSSMLTAHHGAGQQPTRLKLFFFFLHIDKAWSATCDGLDLHQFSKWGAVKPLSLPSERCGSEEMDQSKECF